MNKQEKVCAIVVTYNRKNHLIKCLEAILNQTRPVDAIYIIDNASTDGTPELLKEKGFIKDLPPKKLNKPWEKKFKKNNIPIYYVRINENTGGAGGFYEGIKRAYEKGYDWFWLMDDDGIPDIKCLETLLKYKEKGDFLAPLVIDINKKNELSFGIWDVENKKIIKNVHDVKKEIYEKTANPFNGILISKKLVSKIGLPKKEMFIWGDEKEYLLRALKNNFNVLTISKAIHYHPKGRVNNKKILNLFYVNWSKNVLKNYCGIRNKAFILKKYSKFPYLSLLKFFLKYGIASLFDKEIDFKFFKKAFFDGIKEVWGEEKKYLEK
ncbi:MAG TPA: glycosyltransferase [Nautiliaceae bacterium]|nr:glycosyltransferase [Nautiliaceae bacterium]